jgi:hypothetical protein
MKPANPSSNPIDKQSYSNAVQRLRNDKGFQTYVSNQLKSPEDSQRIETIKKFSEKELNRYISTLSPTRIDPRSLASEEELNKMRRELEKREKKIESEKLDQRVKEYFSRDKPLSERQRYLRGEQVGKAPTLREKAGKAFGSLRKGAEKLKTEMLTVNDGSYGFHHKTPLTEIFRRSPMRSHREEVEMQRQRQDQTGRWPAR